MGSGGSGGSGNEPSIIRSPAALSLQDFYEEHALQAFRRLDKKTQGFITTLEFYDIMNLLKNHLLTDFVRENLVAVGTLE